MAEQNDYSVRLNRIETKLDKLTEALTMIARVDEKITAGALRVDRLEFRLDEQEADLDKVKGIVGYNSQSVKVAERFVWILISSIVGLVMYNFRTRFNKYLALLFLLLLSFLSVRLKRNRQYMSAS